jgi:enamine deaminase RidA (YjgF/YER057c/UK114 family)/ketosteroid isomerase-like protein
MSDALSALTDLAERFWAWRLATAPRTRDDIPRVVRPAGWRPAWSSAAVADGLRFLDGVERRWGAVEPSDDPAAEVPRRLLGSAIARVRWELEIVRSWRRDPWFYLDQSIGHVFDALLPPGDFDAARSADVVERLRWIPATLDVARDNLATTATREFAELALRDSADAAAQLRTSIGLLAPLLDGEWRDAAVTAADEAARALADWRSWLTDRLPAFSPHRPVGRAAFGFFLHRVALLPYTTAEIVALAAQERDRAEAFELFERVRSGPPRWPSPPATAEEQSERERAAELDMRAFYEGRDVLSQPATLRHYRNLPLPDHLVPLRWLGVTDDLTDERRLDRDGVSYVPAPSPDLPYFYRANAADPRAGIIHEGAHYQQLALTWRHPDPAHRQFYDSVPNEGIAFYNEEMVLQAGLFDDAPLTRAIVYNFMRLRAIRVDVDVKLALGEIGIDGAARMLHELVPLDLETAREEAAFFAATPGQGLSYQVGKVQVLRLLADAARRAGEGFDLRGFHDALWSDGNVPLAVQRLQLIGDAGDLRRADALAEAAPDADVRRLALDLLDAITSGDVDRVDRLYADDVRVWHNHDGVGRDKAESLDAVRRIGAHYDGFHATDVRIDVIPEGYVQRCVFRGRERSTGSALSVDAMMRVEVKDGRIVRIEEYSDPSQGAVPSPDTAPASDMRMPDSGVGDSGASPPGPRFRDGAGWEEQAGYSRAARQGSAIAVSGTTAHGPDGSALYPGDTYAQTAECLRRAVAAVEELGGARTSVLRTRLLLAPAADWREASRAHAEALGDVAPANSTYVVGSLIGPDFLVEVEVDAEAVDR